MTERFTEEQLSAFLDGELDPQVHSELEAALETDTALIERLESLARIDDKLRPAFSASMTENIPVRFKDLLAPDPHKTSWPSFSAWLAPRNWAPAAAALVVGALGGALLKTEHTPSIAASGSGQLIARGELGTTLDTVASGETVQTKLGPVRVRLSFRSDAGKTCRQFNLGSHEGVACRTDGGWQIDTLAPAPSNVFAEGYQMANGDVSEAVEKAIRRIGVSEVLFGDEEVNAISKARRTVPRD